MEVLAVERRGEGEDERTAPEVGNGKDTAGIH